ncbi:hypothetical protein CSA56_12345 [candidate division KSB3 bacterium]|uniref:Uncharacterized protein n=1 Tax=candidate division KSB3 bacterium TaxID=2044937 RepID=A0A2G6KC34_9BACT|nr:MAG: hypothetical protein CSA56_12345 [candidate division KSB3 bacterium]
MTYNVLLKRLWNPFLSLKEKWNRSLPFLMNKFVVTPFLRLGIGAITPEKTAHSIEIIGKVSKKFQEGYSIILIPSHPMARRHTLAMMYHCMKLSLQISGQYPHVVLATDEITFVYLKFRPLNRLVQYLYRTIGTLSGHLMLNRHDPNSSFRAGIDIARLLRNQSIVVMAGEGYPRHDSRKYVDIPNSVETFYSKLKHKNILPPSIDKSHFVSELVREIQELIDREDRNAYRNGRLSDHTIESIKHTFIQKIPSDSSSISIEDVMDELLMSWGERFGQLQGIDPVLGVTVQPRHKTLILPVVFTESDRTRIHIDVRDFFLIDYVSYTEVKSSIKDMEKIQNCNIAFDMLGEHQHVQIIGTICRFTGIIYTPAHPLFEEYHAGRLPFQELCEIIRDKLTFPRNPLELQQAEIYRDYLNNFKTAADIAELDDEDRAMLREAAKLNIADLENIIPSIRIRQAWKEHETAQ